MGVGGPIGAVLAFFITRVLGSMLDKGLILVDIGIDQLKQALQDKEWRAEALDHYEKAGARLYTEDEKNAIRNEYLEALKKYATYGNGGAPSGPVTHDPGMSNY